MMLQKHNSRVPIFLRLLRLKWLRVVLLLLCPSDVFGVQKADPGLRGRGAATASSLYAVPHPPHPFNAGLFDGRRGQGRAGLAPAYRTHIAPVHPQQHDHGGAGAGAGLSLPPHQQQMQMQTPVPPQGSAAGYMFSRHSTYGPPLAASGADAESKTIHAAAAQHPQRLFHFEAGREQILDGSCTHTRNFNFYGGPSAQTSAAPFPASFPQTSTSSTGGSGPFDAPASASSPPGNIRIRAVPKRALRSYEFRLFFALQYIGYDGGPTVPSTTCPICCEDLVELQNEHVKEKSKVLQERKARLLRPGAPTGGTRTGLQRGHQQLLQDEEPEAEEADENENRANYSTEQELPALPRNTARACVLRCGHIMCVGCAERMDEQPGQRHRCSVCRIGNRSEDLPSFAFLEDFAQIVYEGHCGAVDCRSRSAGSFTVTSPSAEIGARGNKSSTSGAQEVFSRPRRRKNDGTGCGDDLQRAGASSPLRRASNGGEDEETRAPVVVEKKNDAPRSWKSARSLMRSRCECREELCPRQFCVSDFFNVKHADQLMSLFIDHGEQSDSHSQGPAILADELWKKIWHSAVVPYVQREFACWEALSPAFRVNVNPPERENFLGAGREREPSGRSGSEEELYQRNTPIAARSRSGSSTTSTITSSPAEPAAAARRSSSPSALSRGAFVRRRAIADLIRSVGPTRACAAVLLAVTRDQELHSRQQGTDQPQRHRLQVSRAKECLCEKRGGWARRARNGVGGNHSSSTTPGPPCSSPASCRGVAIQDAVSEPEAQGVMRERPSPGADVATPLLRSHRGLTSTRSTNSDESSPEYLDQVEVQGTGTGSGRGDNQNRRSDRLAELPVERAEAEQERDETETRDCDFDWLSSAPSVADMERELWGSCLSCAPATTSNGGGDEDKGSLPEDEFARSSDSEGDDKAIDTSTTSTCTTDLVLGGGGRDFAYYLHRPRPCDYDCSKVLGASAVCALDLFVMWYLHSLFFAPSPYLYPPSNFDKCCSAVPCTIPCCCVRTCCNCCGGTPSSEEPGSVWRDRFLSGAEVDEIWNRALPVGLGHRCSRWCSTGTEMTEPETDAESLFSEKIELHPKDHDTSRDHRSVRFQRKSCVEKLATAVDRVGSWLCAPLAVCCADYALRVRDLVKHELCAPATGIFDECCLSECGPCVLGSLWHVLCNCDCGPLCDIGQVPAPGAARSRMTGNRRPPATAVMLPCSEWLLAVEDYATDRNSATASSPRSSQGRARSRSRGSTTAGRAGAEATRTSRKLREHVRGCAATTWSCLTAVFPGCLRQKTLLEHASELQRILEEAPATGEFLVNACACTTIYVDEEDEDEQDHDTTVDAGGAGERREQVEGDEVYLYPARRRRRRPLPNRKDPHPHVASAALRRKLRRNIRPIADAMADGRTQVFAAMEDLHFCLHAMREDKAL